MRLARLTATPKAAPEKRYKKSRKGLDKMEKAQIISQRKPLSALLSCPKLCPKTEFLQTIYEWLFFAFLSRGQPLFALP